MSLGPEEVKELTKNQWIELRKGIEFMAIFAKLFSGGIKEVITLTKKSAKGQVNLASKTLLQPIINVIDETANKITGSLGINAAIKKIENMIASVLNSFAAFLTSLLNMFTDLEDDQTKRNLTNLIGWILFFLNGFSRTHGFVTIFGVRIPII